MRQEQLCPERMMFKVCSLEFMQEKGSSRAPLQGAMAPMGLEVTAMQQSRLPLPAMPGAQEILQRWVRLTLLSHTKHLLHITLVRPIHLEGGC
jgi:hypothetical protein